MTNKYASSSIVLDYGFLNFWGLRNFSDFDMNPFFAPKFFM